MNSVLTLSCELEVQNRAGLHTRVALMIFKTMEKFQSEAKFTNEGRTASCRSVLEMLSLGVGKGEKVILTIKGDDAVDVQKEITRLFNERFFEDEIVPEPDS